MKRGKKLLALLLVGMMAVPQVGVYAEELTDGAIEIDDGELYNGIEELDISDDEAIYTDNTENSSDNTLSLVGEASSGTCGRNLTWKLENGILTISGTGDMDDLLYWYAWEHDDGGFEEAAPWESNDVKEVIIETGVTSIGEGMFNNCKNLTKVTIPGSVTIIKEGAFLDCKNLKEVRFLNNGLIVISAYAFSGCESLNAFNIPITVEMIGTKAFRYCYSLANITIPKEVTCIGDDAFFESIFESIEVDQNNSAYTVYEGILYSLDKKILLKCPSGRGGVATIPDSVIRISDNAFYNCDKLTSVFISKNIERIGVGAFHNCTALKEIHFKGNTPVFEDVVILNDEVYVYPSDAFHGVTAIAFYPSNYPSWTEKVRQDYEGKITWVPVIDYSMPPTITNVYNSVKGGDIRWKKVNGAVGYIIYRFRSAEGKKIVASISDPNTVQCFDREIRDNCYGRVYNYYVTALYKDTDGNTVESFPSEGFVLQRLAPMKITDTIQTSGSSVSIKWDCTVKENKSYGYEVQYAESSADLYDRKGTFQAFLVDGRSNLTAAIKGLKNGKKYWIRVRCYVKYTHSVTGVTTSTWSQYSNVVSIKLAAVSSVKPSYQVTDSVVNYRSGIWIYWTPTNAKGYNIYRKTGVNGQWKLLKYISGQSSYRYHDESVKDNNGVLYYYTVRGVIGSKLSDYDKSGRGIMRLIPVDFTRVENNQPGNVSLSWNMNSAATGYEIRYGRDKNMSEENTSFVNIPTNTNNIAEIKGLYVGNTYYFNVRPYTIQGGDTYYGQWSSLGNVFINDQ